MRMQMFDFKNCKTVVSRIAIWIFLSWLAGTGANVHAAEAESVVLLHGIARGSGRWKRSRTHL